MEYEKLRKLGNGCQGEVWMVKHKKTGVVAAMKLYDMAKCESAYREIHILKRFGGKGVPYLIDYIETQQQIMIFMEYIEGDSLRIRMMQKHIWDEKEVMRIGGEISRILTQFHQQLPALIYGDLKPENIMLDKNGKIYLIDFGSIIEMGEKQRKLYGTKEYLPPVEEGITPYRDTYGLGVIMYELLTGVGLQEGITTGKVDISHVSVKCQKILQRAVRIRKEAGYSSAGMMYEAIMSYEKEGMEEKGMNKLRGYLKRKKKEDYYITDLKRVVCHGYKQCLLFLLLGVFVFATGFMVKETEAANLQAKISVTERREIRELADILTEINVNEGKENVNQRKEAYMAEREAVKNVDCDMYGRKLLVRSD